MTTSTTTDFSGLAFVKGLAVALVLAIVFIPLWAVDIPPMMDYPNHLARQYILERLPTSDYLQTYYVATWTASPYLAMDAIVQVLATFMPIATAGKVFLTLMFLLLALAPLALNWALFGRASLIALLGLLFIHNNTVTLGFVNYLFAVGFALCLLALWIRARDGPPWIRLSVFPLLATLLFLSHLFGLVIYGIAAAAYELGCHIDEVSARKPHAPFHLDASQWLTLLSLVLQCVIPLCIFLLFGPSTEGLSENMYGGIERKLVLLFGAFVNLIPAYSWTLDSRLRFVLPIAILILLARRKLEFSRAMLLPVAGLLGLYFAMPQVLFGQERGDHRLFVALALMITGALRMKPGAWSPVTYAAAVTAIAALVVTRIVTVTIEWRQA
ncbi:MAG TPA: hypothetical protein VMQ50_10565, partial [Casimicrobiaceae bacterium]|nr:hypothetical protein [Casimicrobiaceae bacterium]